MGKKEDHHAPPPGIPKVHGPPTDRVLQLRKNGLSNSQIIDNLQREGVDMTDIFDAMNQAEIKIGVGMGQAPTMMGNMPNMPSDELSSDGGKQFPGGMIRSVAQDPEMEYPSEQSSDMNSMSSMNSVPGLDRIEELAEAIIDEKWNEIVKSINKIIDWKDRTESRLVKIEQQMADMQKQFDGLHKGVLGKIGDYDRNLMTIGSDIKAMEKVFGKVLPIMTENINELGRITQDMKQRQQ